MDEDAERDWSGVWCASGAAGLSGLRAAPPLDVPIALVQAVTAAAERIAELSDALGSRVDVDGPALLAERAAISGLARRGPISCGGGTRLLHAADGWVALSLVRPSDVESLPAWLHSADPALMGDDLDEVWAAVTGEIARRSVVDLIERGILLGLPLARLGEARADPDPAPALGHGVGGARLQRIGSVSLARPLDEMVVVDLSSLWAGPLCAQLLGQAGMRVIKVESLTRPDGARAGPTEFFDLLHVGHESVALDFADVSDRHALAALIDRADVVIEASRPRALAQLGVAGPEQRGHGGPQVWLSVTAHGRTGRAADRVGFGDDAAVAGGLVTTADSGDGQEPCFCADAVADPLTGMVAAGLVLDRIAAGERWSIDIALARTATAVANGPLTTITGLAAAAPRARPVSGRAAPLGAHTDAVLADFRVTR